MYHCISFTLWIVKNTIVVTQLLYHSNMNVLENHSSLPILQSRKLFETEMRRWRSQSGWSVKVSEDRQWRSVAGMEWCRNESDTTGEGAPSDAPECGPPHDFWTSVALLVSLGEWIICFWFFTLISESSGKVSTHLKTFRKTF